MRFRLLILGLIIAAACTVAAYLMIEMFQISVTAQIDRASAILSRGCANIADRYRLYVAGWNGPKDLQNEMRRRGLQAVVSLALRDDLGVEGGIWQDEAGPLAYAYPTYEGGGIKSDIPVAEFDRIKAINQSAAGNEEPREARYPGRSQTLLIRSCPLPGPVSGLTAWTMTRVFTAAWEGYGNLKAGLLVLFGCAAVAAILITRILRSWSKHIGNIESKLETGGTDLPPLPLTGELELDRIIHALNQAGERLIEARRQSDRLNKQVAAAERLASIGRLSAGVAHEIRNPIAAMRLKAENALADGSRSEAALKAIIEQIDRLDRLARQLLSTSNGEVANPVLTQMIEFLEEVVQPYVDLAHAKDINLSVTSQIEQAAIDPKLTRRALENLITNGLEHTPSGGSVTVDARPNQNGIVIEVRDTGPGIAEEIAGSLFEPFVSGRSGGTGLGLAIAAEAVKSEGGFLRLVPSATGAVFQIELQG